MAFIFANTSLHLSLWVLSKQRTSPFHSFYSFEASLDPIGTILKSSTSSDISFSIYVAVESSLQTTLTSRFYCEDLFISGCGTPWCNKGAMLTSIHEFYMGLPIAALILFLYSCCYLTEIGSRELLGTTSSISCL